ncbi:MAG: DNA-binding response regulator [Clostridiales bacterium]|nr:MAG: DNA-binding response regulator [Clostridiales bacterium]
MSSIFVIEDEIAINKMICLNLNSSGYQATPSYDGKEALNTIMNGEHFDLALVDVMLPGVDGFSLLKPLTDRGIPVIFLTAKGDLDSKLQGLKNGAEDYIVKPFELPELLARVENVLKRYGTADNVLTADDIVITLNERSAKKKNMPLMLTPIEFDLLVALTRNKNIALSRNKLLADVWGVLFDGETRTVDVHIAQLRKKTGLNIVTVPKVGYRLEETV